MRPFPQTMEGECFAFYPGYSLPIGCRTSQDYTNFLAGLPQLDIPEVFGLHGNAGICQQISLITGILDS